MCPKNGTIFILRVPGMGLFIFCLVYVYIGNNIDLVESTPGVVFSVCMVGILQRVVFIFLKAWILYGYWCGILVYGTLV